jgi:hypothetical protein
MSDLHLDISNQNPVLPGGDILILAGDTCEARFHRKTFLNSVDPDHFISRINRFVIDECSKKYEHVIMIAGNHESYNSTIDAAHWAMVDETPDNFHILENGKFEVGGIMFLGATLWTDCNRQDPLTLRGLSTMLNDFSVIYTVIDKKYSRLTPQDTVLRHLNSLKYFRRVLAHPANSSKPVIMITHHAPSALSVPDQLVEQVVMSGGYYSRLDDFILDHPQIKYWIHGHIHTATSYMVGDYTRVLANPRGYQNRKYAQDTGWDPNAFIEL